MKILPQIKRHFIVLVCLVAIFLVIRHFLVPASFGEYGHYRGNALGENAARQTVYAGQETCRTCHDDIFKIRDADAHAVLTCETCHGAGQLHAKLAESGGAGSPDSMVLVRPQTREFCGLCHSKNAARRMTVVNQIDMNEHNAGLSCIDCHNPHKPLEITGEVTAPDSAKKI